MDKSTITTYRAFLKDSLRLQIDFSQTDQHRGVAPPPLQKPPAAGQALIPLPKEATFKAFHGADLVTAIGNRRHR